MLYLVPQTSVLGAILLTGYLGGAIATHLRVGSPIFSHLLFGLYLGLMVWGGLYLRDPWLRALIPLRRDATGPCDRMPRLHRHGKKFLASGVGQRSPQTSFG